MEKKARTKQWPQYLAALTGTLSLAVAGAHIGWTSPVLPKLKGPDSHIPLTNNDASWIASFYLLGSIPGNILAAFMVDSIGRKVSLLLAGLPLTFGWLLIIFAWHPYVLYASRFISGLGQGIIYVVCPMYIGEIADKNIRGSLGSFIKLMVTFGELYAHAIGPFVSYDWLAYSCILVPVVFFLTFTWMPESPYYLLIHNKREKAEKNLIWLKRYSRREDLEEDMDLMHKTVIMNISNRGHVLDLFNTPGNRRAMMICLGLQLILQFSGIAAIESYTQEIMEASGSGISAAMAVIVLSVVQLISGIAAAGLVDRLGRKPLLLLTTMLAGVVLGVSAGFYYLKIHEGWDMSRYGGILVIAIISYELIIALGLSPLPYMMLGELFPTNVKGFAVSMANLWASLLAFVVSKMHQVVSDHFGIYTSFMWYASTCFIGIIFIVLVVPETKGKSLLEIQEELNFRKKRPKIKDVEMHVNTIS